MPTLTENIKLPGDVDPSTVTTTVELWGAGEPITGFETTAGKSIAGTRKITGNPWTIPDLVGNADIEVPAGSVYRVHRTWPGLRAPLVDYVDLPAAGGPYIVGDELADPPAALTPSGLSAHAADTSLHGGGQRLFVANVAANFTTASTSFVDIPGASGTFTVPARPFVLKGQFPVTVEEAQRGAEVRMMTGATMIAWGFVPPVVLAGTTFNCQFEAHIPASTWAPVAGSVVTVRATMRTTLASSDASIIVDFAGPFNICQLWGHTV